MSENPQKPASLDAPVPKIPGVPPAKPKKPTPPRTPEPEAQHPPAYLWAAGGAALLIVLVAIVWWLDASKRQQQAIPVVNTAATPFSAKPSATPSTAAPPTAPGVIATTDELSQPWAAKKFFFRNPRGRTSPAMLVRLPDGTYWAFSLIEPYGSCELEYITDLEKLRTEYNFSATHPMVGDACSHTVFDLSQYGSGPSGEVRGEIVAGTGVRPPLAIEVEINGTKILATRAEPDILH